MKDMTVAKLVDTRRLELFAEPIPEPRVGQVLLKMKIVGICGSDLHYFLEGGLGSFKSKFPLALGHEPSGVIVQANGSHDFKAGDRVAIDPALPCMRCDCCERGLLNLCRNVTFMGTNSSGAFQEYMVADERQIVRLDDDLSNEEGAMLEPLGVAVHSVRLARMEEGASVVVFGAGPIGLCLIIAAKVSGAGEVFIVDPLTHRVRMGVDIFGAEHGIVTPETDPVDYIRTVTGGRGVEFAFDAAGMQRTVHQCFDCLGPGGKAVLVGIPTFDYVSYNPHVARTKELTIINVRRSNHTLSRCLNLLKLRNLPVRELVTHRFGIERVQAAFETAAGYHDGVVKAVITFA